MNQYYVYEWIRLDNNEPFYVGKGKGERCFTEKKRNKYFNDILKYCRNNSIEIAINILESGLSNEEALMTECWYINEYICTYGFNITNQTWGGEGGDVVSMMSVEERIKYSIKMRNSCLGKNKGHIHSEESKLKMSKVKKGMYLGNNNPMYGKNIKDYMDNASYEAWKSKIRNSMKGKTHSEETKEKIRKALLGRKISEETKEKLRNLNKGEKNPMYGRRHTESNKALMSKCHEKSVMVEFPNGKKMSFESRNKCIEYFQKNYDVGIYTIKKLIRTKEKLKSKYKKFKKLEGIRIYYI